MKTLIKRLFSASFIRFLMVGVLNTAVGSAIMFGGYNLLSVPHWPDTTRYWFFSALGYVLPSIMSFFINRRFTFRSGGKLWPQFWRFALSISVCYAIAYGAAKPLIRHLLSNGSQRLQSNVAMLAGAVVFTLLNYVGQRFFAFRKGTRAESAPPDGAAHPEKTIDKEDPNNA